MCQIQVERGSEKALIMFMYVHVEILQYWERGGQSERGGKSKLRTREIALVKSLCIM